MLAVSYPNLIERYGVDSRGLIASISYQKKADPNGSRGLAFPVLGPSPVEYFVYNSYGKVLRHQKPGISAASTYGYDSLNNLTSITNEEGLLTSLSAYDANGRPGLLVEPNGRQTTYAYDSRGRLLRVVENGAQTSYAYSPAGRLLSKAEPSGLGFQFGYDSAGRLVQQTDSLGNQVNLTLDLEGNAIQQTLKDRTGELSLLLQRSFNASSKKILELAPQ